MLLDRPRRDLAGNKQAARNDIGLTVVWMRQIQESFATQLGVCIAQDAREDGRSEAAIPPG